MWYVAQLNISNYFIAGEYGNIPSWVAGWPHCCDFWGVTFDGLQWSATFCDASGSINIAPCGMVLCLHIKFSSGAGHTCILYIYKCIPNRRGYIWNECLILFYRTCVTPLNHLYGLWYNTHFKKAQYFNMDTFFQAYLFSFNLVRLTFWEAQFKELYLDCVSSDHLDIPHSGTLIS